MMFNAGCWKRQLAALAVATSLLSGCAAGISEPSIATVCPPVVEYTREFQARAAEELALLPDGSAVVEMMGDYAVMRDQTRLCNKPQALISPQQQHAVIVCQPDILFR